MQETSELIRSSRFRAEREADWRRLEALVAQAERAGVHRMDFAAVRDLAELYRQAATSLAVAREISLDRALLDYLEALTARAYLSVYAPQERIGGVLRRFLTASAPAAMRRSWPFLLIALLTLTLGAVTGAALYVEDPSWYSVFMPGDMAHGRGPGSSTAELRASIYGPPESDGLGAFATYLFSHNTRIAIFVFGLGVFLCAPALLLTFYNGLTLGAFVALYADRGLSWDIFAWLSVHGVTELSAVCIACAGGLQLGAAVLFPGERSRAEALRFAGRDAAKLAMVAAMMLVVAALLEGFARQLIQDPAWRAILGWSVGALWLLWVLRTGRRTG